MLKSIYFILLCFTVTLFSQEVKIDLNPVGTYATGIFDGGAVEILGFDVQNDRVFFTNADDNSVYAIDVTDVTNPTFAFKIDLSALDAKYGGPNSIVVDYTNNYVAIAVEDTVKTNPGYLVFTDLDGNFIKEVTVGILPDMVALSGNHEVLMVANEGEPNDDVSIDPEGSITVIKITDAGGVSGLTQSDVVTLDFSGFNSSELEDVKLAIETSSVAQNLEPEYIAISQNGNFAIVTLQDNNAFAKVDLTNNSIEWIKSLGFKDYSLVGNEIDASNKDNIINIQNWPVFGMYQPDAIGSFFIEGTQYFITANEGDAMDYDGFSEEERIKDVDLDPTAFPNADDLQENENLGRLNITTVFGDTDNDGDFDELYSYGARSFSIWDEDGNIVFDSGSDFETKVAAMYPEYFNSNNDDNDSFDSRSDDKGPEPEAVETATINGKTYAFIGLERMGGIMVYDITDPSNSEFNNYVLNRNFMFNADTPEALDLGPECIKFIPAESSPTNEPLLFVGNEVSGTLTIYEIDPVVVPVELSAFSAVIVNNTPVLTWETATESNNKGFEILKSTDNVNFNSIAFVAGNGTTTEVNTYSYSDLNATSGKVYYKLKQIDFDGSVNVSPSVKVEVGTPESFALSQNYPNPFNPSTTISYSLPENANVKLSVYDILGREVATLVNETKEAGKHNVSFNASQLSSGLYFYKIEAGNFVKVNKMTLLK